MTHLDTELEELRESILEMMRLARTQLEKSREAFLEMDTDLAEEIVHSEKRLNAIELKIDKDCENIIALLQPVATDLRFVLAMLKINSNLERIGDHAFGIAKYVLDVEKAYKDDILTAIQLREMYELALNMLSDVIEAYEESDSKLARKIFKRDKALNKINRNASKVLAKFVEKDPACIRHALYLFSVIRKLERIGDLVKNIAEDIIFHLEAEVLRHQSKKKIKADKQP